jgi:hypothetical protein
MPILALLESPEFGLFELGESVCEEPVESVCDDPVFDAPRDAMGNRERSLASHATYNGSAMAIPRVMVVMFDTVDWSFITCS